MQSLALKKRNDEILQSFIFDIFFNSLVSGKSHFVQLKTLSKSNRNNERKSLPNTFAQAKTT